MGKLCMVQGESKEKEKGGIKRQGLKKEVRRRRDV